MVGRDAPASGSNGASTGVSTAPDLAQHGFEHMVAANAQLSLRHLQVGVAIADVPGEAHQIERAAGGDFDQWLGTSLHRHDRSVVEHEAVAVAQRRRRFRDRAGTSCLSRRSARCADAGGHRHRERHNRWLRRRSTPGRPDLGSAPQLRQHCSKSRADVLQSRTESTAAPSAAPERARRSTTRHRR